MCIELVRIGMIELLWIGMIGLEEWIRVRGLGPVCLSLSPSLFSNHFIYFFSEKSHDALSFFVCDLCLYPVKYLFHFVFYRYEVEAKESGSVALKVYMYFLKKAGLASTFFIVLMLILNAASTVAASWWYCLPFPLYFSSFSFLHVVTLVRFPLLHHSFPFPSNFLNGTVISSSIVLFLSLLFPKFSSSLPPLSIPLSRAFFVPVFDLSVTGSSIGPMTMWIASKTISPSAAPSSVHNPP